MWSKVVAWGQGETVVLWCTFRTFPGRRALTCWTLRVCEADRDIFFTISCMRMEGGRGPGGPASHTRTFPDLVPPSLGTKPYYSITQVPLYLLWPLSQYKRPSELDTQAKCPPPALGCTLDDIKAHHARCNKKSIRLKSIKGSLQLALCHGKSAFDYSYLSSPETSSIRNHPLWITIQELRMTNV